MPRDLQNVFQVADLHTGVESKFNSVLLILTPGPAPNSQFWTFYSVGERDVTHFAAIGATLKR